MTGTNPFYKNKTFPGDFEFANKKDTIEMYRFEDCVNIAIENRNERISINIPKEHWKEFVEHINNIKF